MRSRGFDSPVVRMICEKCLKEHDGIFGSGRFCSTSCARSFATKSKRSLINKKVSDKLSFAPKVKICKHCLQEFQTKSKKKVFCNKVCASKFYGWSNSHKSITSEKWSEIHKKSYAKGRKVYGGKTKWFTYKDIKVQGTFEFRTCFILDQMKERKEIFSWEYTNDRIKYIAEDLKQHSYLFDFKVFINELKF